MVLNYSYLQQVLETRDECNIHVTYSGQFTGHRIYSKWQGCLWNVKKVLPIVSSVKEARSMDKKLRKIIEK